VSRRRKIVATAAVALCLIGAALLTYLGASAGGTSADRRLSGGAEATVSDTSANAFASPVPKQSHADRRAFVVGNSFFNRNWVTAPASTSGRDGLGPTFNAMSCSSCHLKDGRGQPPTRASVPELGLLLRLSVDGPDGSQQPVPRYGGQLQDRAINGVPAEGSIRITHTPLRGRYADGTPYELAAPHYAIADRAYGPLPSDVRMSPRVAPSVFGVGLLEAVPERTIVARSDPGDADGDGVSGRVNRVGSERSGGTALGRFGWKANVPTVEQQNAGAFNGDIGITSPIFPAENCSGGQKACRAATDGGEPEIDQRKLDRVTRYVRTLAVPARRRVGASDTSAGERTFSAIGCSACHLPELRTASSDVPALADQDIRPYTDLLLHDMGPALADDRPDGLASGSEWRTAPLWGIGLVKTVNKHTRFLHDGRARNVEEAILWHGGEAQAAADRFRKLPRSEREQLIAFLESL
jgi:CxxC motif-containing protein (DUF1111 family)